MKYLLLTTFLFMACNSLQKAENKVLADPGARIRVFRAVEPQFPCNNDTIITFKRDTITHIDSQYSVVPEYIQGPGDTIYKVQTKYITRTQIIHDSVGMSVTDLRRLDIARDSLNFYKGQLNQQKGETAAEKSKREAAEALAAKRWWLIILVASLGVASHFIRSKIF